MYICWWYYFTFSVDCVYYKVLLEASLVSSSYNSLQPFGGVSEQQSAKGCKLVEKEKKKSEDKAKLWARWSPPPPQPSVCLSVPSFIQQCELASPPNHASSGQRSPRRNLLLVLLLLFQGCVSCHLQSTLLKCCHISWLLSWLLHSIYSRLGSVEVPQSTDD